MSVIPICLRPGWVRGQVGDCQLQAYEWLPAQRKQGGPIQIHGQSLELCVADPGTELGLRKLEVALADLIVTTALLQEVDLSPLGTGLVSVEDGSHKGEPLARRLPP